MISHLCGSSVNFYARGVDYKKRSGVSKVWMYGASKEATPTHFASRAISDSIVVSVSTSNSVLPSMTDVITYQYPGVVLLVFVLEW